MTIDFKKLKLWYQFKREAEMELLDDDLYSVMCSELLTTLKEFAIANENFAGKIITIPGKNDTKLQKIFVNKFNEDLFKHATDWRINSTGSGDYIFKPK